MALLTELLLEFVVLICSILLVGFLVLLFRNPHRSQWLHAEIAQTAAALVFVIASVLGFATFVNGLLNAGLTVFTALSIAVLAEVIAVYVAARLFGFRKRLKNADAGNNPFHSIGERQDESAATAATGELT